MPTDSPLIHKAQSRGKLGIMVTHALEMAALADQVLEVHAGSLTPRSTTTRIADA